jgi:hypothetical protein
MRARVTITVEESRLATLDASCQRRRITRSRAVEEALVLWERQREEQELAAGYDAMRDENLRTAETNLVAWANRGTLP